MIHKKPVYDLNTLTLIRPDDWHTHFREGSLMRLVTSYTSRVFSRAIAMPNLSPPITTAVQCANYRTKLVAAGAAGFNPLMTLYLTDETTADTIRTAKPDPENYDIVFGAKLYPHLATTNAQHGLTDPLQLLPVFETMQEQKLPLLIHGEISDDDSDIYDREKIFIDQVLQPIRHHCPTLKIVFEHITSREAVNIIYEDPNTAATITPHHLLYNRNALFESGLRPDRYCLPLAKREADRTALIEAACSENPRFFAGTDSAPHLVGDKHTACGCAGIFNAPCALETYTEIFEQNHALHQLEAFVSLNGATFYNVASNTEKITLMKKSWQMPDTITDGSNTIIPFRAGETITWSCAHD